MKLSRFEKWANKGVMNMGEYSEYAKYMQLSINMLSNFCDNVPTDEIPPYLIFDEKNSLIFPIFLRILVFLQLHHR